MGDRGAVIHARSKIFDTRPSLARPILRPAALSLSLSHPYSHPFITFPPPVHRCRCFTLPPQRQQQLTSEFTAAGPTEFVAAPPILPAASVLRPSQGPGVVLRTYFSHLTEK